MKTKKKRVKRPDYLKDYDYEAFDKDHPDSVIWCLHCERTYKRSDARTIIFEGSPIDICGHEGCDAAVFMDGWDWEKVRLDRENPYPKEPEAGKRYPLYETGNAIHD